MKTLKNYKGYALYILLTCVLCVGCVDVKNEVEKDELSILSSEFRSAENNFDKCDSVFNEALKTEDIIIMLAYHDSCIYYRNIMVKTIDKMKALENAR